MTNEVGCDVTEAALWSALARHDRPVRALLAFAAVQPDQQAAIDAVLAELTDEARADLSPLIEAEKVARDAWLARHGGGNAP